MPWDREFMEEYDDGYTRESFERAEEDTGDDDELDVEHDPAIKRIYEYDEPSAEEMEEYEVQEGNES